MGGSESVRIAAQPFIVDAVARGASSAEIASLLRERLGHAYRRSEFLADVRAHRERAVASPAPSQPCTPAARLHATIAQLGVAVFAIALLVPTIVYDASRAKGGVLIAAASEVRGDVPSDVSLPNQVAPLARRLVTTTPAPAPTATPTAPPTTAPVVVADGGPGVVVTASWYGPGFFGNRLPCWQWLEAQGQPIQFLPDTWGVANKTLPCGTELTLTHGAATVRVPVVDRGPYIAGRELDLSPAVKAALACSDLCTVVMQIP